MTTTPLKYLGMAALVLMGIVGAYDFAIQGSGNPLVWAFEGRFAPLFWVSAFGIVIWSLWASTNERGGSDIQ